jgi:hypothetical protein
MCVFFFCFFPPSVVLLGSFYRVFGRFLTRAVPKRDLKTAGIFPQPWVCDLANAMGVRRFFLVFSFYLFCPLCQIEIVYGATKNSCYLLGLFVSLLSFSPGLGPPLLRLGVLVHCASEFRVALCQVGYGYGYGLCWARRSADRDRQRTAPEAERVAVCHIIVLAEHLGVDAKLCCDLIRAVCPHDIIWICTR